MKTRMINHLDITMFKKLCSVMLLSLLLAACSFEPSQLTRQKTWTFVTKTDSYTGYADFSSIQKDNHNVRIWTLTDSPEEDRNAHFLSLMVYYEISCANGQVRSQRYNAYSGNMGSGELVESMKTPSGWLDLSYHPDTAFLGLLRDSVCY